ncbi:hypothetical protein ACJRPK_05890 [Aquimarina sp. 2-A2]|uniref:NlpE-like protein n=1 Tax=Aquimarina intermedia TaxID=350814 RepID=A0A5S5C7A1_9FLAO|nr:hypothetical protein [Aquimarina intermedia]TYP75301.1 hypothetical protein BD809_103365 [Aquimarina intermedia]
MNKIVLLVVTLIMTTSFAAIGNNPIEETTVTYNGQSDKAYYFTNKETGKVMEITFVSKKAISKFDLSAKENIGKTFLITYEKDQIEVSNPNNPSDAEVKQYKHRLILTDIKAVE